MQTVSRLIDQFVPEHYDLSLTLHRIERNFNGTVTIHGTSQPGSEHIIVHSKELAIQSVTFDGKEAYFAASDDDELFITHPDLLPGKHIIVIVFSGIISDAMHGLYPCYYEHDGVKKELLATQFESHHAREAFPCIDEPAAKATFDVTLTTESGIIVLGNMPIHDQVTDGQMMVTTFEATPRMSSYLLAWVTGEMHKKSATTKGGVEVNVWATPAQPAESLDFALDIAVRTIDFYNDYFGTAYPLPKSDHVALPDFSSGAMENWGLITYREIALLADPKTTSISMRHYVATVIAHELAHQWFGNLVTMKWWNDLWLNESFATLMEYVAVDALEPDWNVWLDYATYESIIALRRDSINGVQAVQVDVNHPDEINTLFDGAIVYAKGSRLLRMLQYYVGNADFQAGLKDYFSSHAYGNTEASDLWGAISKASGKDITELMNTWISQPGYPVVHVTSDKDNIISLHQERFFVGQHTPNNSVWPIPINASRREMLQLMLEPTVNAKTIDTTTLRLNVGDSSHFVTHYSSELLAKIIDDLKNGKLSPLDRLQLLHEQTLLARGGIISSDELIPLLDAYAGETTEAVWDIMSVAIAELSKFVESHKDARHKLRRLVFKLSNDQYKRLGWESQTNEPEADTKLRATIIGQMIFARDEHAIATALELYGSSKLEDLSPELRGGIISVAVRFGKDNTITAKLIDIYKTTNSTDLKNDILSGLTSTKNSETISLLLDEIKNPEVVRQQDVARWYVNLLSNYRGRTKAWQWLRNNWSWIEQTFSGDKSYDDYPRYSAGYLTSRLQFDEYNTFFEPLKSNPSLKRVITIGQAELEGRVELLERDGDAVCGALLNL